jgi:PAT family beta-lactamase induction signal transducer AmpG
MIRSFKRTYIDPYFSPRVLSIGFFAFPYGMMFFLMVITPQVWLKEIGVDKTNIGLFAIVSLPYVFKFLWAPMVDVVKLPLLHRLGQRRSWLVLVHLSLIIGLVAMGCSNPRPDHLMPIGVIALILSFLAATQDIIVDAYRIEILNKDQSIPGVSMLIFGYRLGSITAKAGPLYLAHYFNWTVAYVIMALLVSIGIIATLFNPEPIHSQEKRTLYQTVIEPFHELIKRSSFWPAVFSFVVFYRFGDAMINNMASAFYLEIGFTKTQIASVMNIFGICATIVGGFLGAAIVRRFKIYGGLAFCGVAHALSNLMFVLLAYVGNDLFTFYLSVAVENITGGMSTAAFFVYLSRLCRLNSAATQFALLTSLWSLSTPLASFSGWIVDCLSGNWVVFFLLTVVAALPGIFLIRVIPKYAIGNEGAIDPISKKA